LLAQPFLENLISLIEKGVRDRGGHCSNWIDLLDIIDSTSRLQFAAEDLIGCPLWMVIRSAFTATVDLLRFFSACSRAPKFDDTVRVKFVGLGAV
jgi:hypothetical protein